MNSVELPLVVAAARLRLSYNQAMRLVLIGEIKGIRRDGRWWVDAADVERLASSNTANEERAL